MLALHVNKKNLFSMQGDDTLEMGPLTIHAVPAAHSKLDFDEQTGYPYLSYVIQIVTILFTTAIILVLPGCETDTFMPDYWDDPEVIGINKEPSRADYTIFRDLDAGKAGIVDS